MVERSFNMLRKVQIEERSHSALSELDEDFFKEYAELIKSEKEKLKKEFSLSGAKAIENTRAILKDIISKREQKILLKALRDVQFNEISSDALTSEERELYLSVVKALKEHFNKLGLSGEEEIKKAVEKGEKKKKTIKVKMLIELPEFVGSDMQTYGPFKKGEIIELRKEEALLLMNRKAAEKVEEG